MAENLDGISHYEDSMTDHCPIEDCPNYTGTQENIKTWMKWILTVIITIAGLHGYLASATYQVAAQSAESLQTFVEKYNVTDKNTAVDISRINGQLQSTEQRVLSLERILRSDLAKILNAEMGDTK